MTDRWAIEGKLPPPAERAELLVIGGGPAGCAAAIEAARAGLRVMLVDENPVDAGLIGLDVPLLYGGRATAAVQNRERLVERVLEASPTLGEAFEAGVDVRLATCCWGAWVAAPGLRALPGPVAGLSDGRRSWMVGFDRLVVAAGARDLVLSFEGSDQPGVVGAQGFHALARLDAFAGRRVVVLGTGALAARTAALALERGLEVAAMVEAGEAPASSLDALRARGVEVVTGHAPLRARGGPDGVEALTLARVGEPARRRELSCDTVVLALGAVPMVELLDVLGAGLRLDAGSGAFVPDVGPGGATSLPQVFVAGDAAGLGGDAEAEGRAAAHAVLASLGRPAKPRPPAPRQEADARAYALSWARTMVAASDHDALACTCEGVTRGDLLGVRPPRYLGWSPMEGGRDLGALLAADPVNQDHVKRLTRAGMGPCQGRRCREQVAMLLALGAGMDLDAIPLPTHRAPVRPLPLSVLGDAEEDAAMAEGWDVWFGIPSQWVPYADIGTDREGAADPVDGLHG